MKTDMLIYKLFNDLYFTDWYKQLMKGAPMRRSKMSHKKSNRVFKKGMGTNRKNVTPAPTRGGYRL
nr:MAG: hypothetical protein [Microvirus sp.]